MLLLEGVLVVEEDVAIQILEACGLAEAQELVVNETILNGVELVDVVDDVFDHVLRLLVSHARLLYFARICLMIMLLHIKL